MGDVAQILAGTSKTQTALGAKKPEESDALPAPPPPRPRGHHPSRAMKMTGLSRDVMGLLGGKEDKASASLPPIVPSFAGQPGNSNSKGTTESGGSIKVGNRWVSSGKPARPWVWAPFKSSARSDGALFRHWVRAGVDYMDYPYARFDVHLDPVVYTTQEYSQFLQNANWTKSETDKLMELARRYELRWAVVYDAWIGAYQSRERKVEDLQYRFYHVAAILNQSRVTKEAVSHVSALSSSPPASGSDAEDAKAATETRVMEAAAARAIATAEPSHQPVISITGSGTTNKDVFDLEKERERRDHLEVLWRRTKEDEHEEAELRKELRLVEAQIRKLKKSGGHILAASNSTSGLSSSRNPSRSVTPVPTAAAMNVSESDLLNQCFAETAPTPMPHTPYLQSARLVAPATGGPVGLNKTTLKRLDDVLSELNVPKRPMPTKRVCDMYDEVRKNALTLLTLQKMLVQKEGQLQGKRLKLSKLGGPIRAVDEETLLGIAPAPSVSTAASSAASGRSKGGSGSKSKSSRSGGGKSKAGSLRTDTGGGSESKTGGKKATKRKKKADSKQPSASMSVSTAATSTATTTKNREDEGKPKKRARKS